MAFLCLLKKIYCHCLHAGADLDSLPSYGKRANRIHLNNREYHLKYEQHIIMPMA